ncbi:MAG: MBL fold metallo-hydrolase [Veillonellaceae bacterium]|nr:MBL fold metallo-hydrolase [Veillonellaceae bacterium]
MLNVAAYASGSSGNCYTVGNGEDTVMLDCGLPYHRVMQRVHFKLPSAIFITHEHQDHAKAARDFMKRGVDVYMSAGTADALGIDKQSEHRLHVIENLETAHVGKISVSAFNVQHDAAEPLGFLLEDKDDRVLYATDTYYLRYKFSGLTKILIEANHSYKILEENVAAGRLDKGLADRLIKSHFSLENLVDFFHANDLDSLKEVWLIHLSQDNADPAQFERVIEAATGKPVYVAGRS